MPRAPIDQATLLFLRPLLADLEAGRVVVTTLHAGDDSDRSFVCSWREAAPEETAAAAAPAIPDGVARVLPGRSRGCPDCGAELRELGNDRVCTHCSWDSTAHP